MTHDVAPPFSPLYMSKVDKQLDLRAFWPLIFVYILHLTYSFSILGIGLAITHLNELPGFVQT